MGHQRPHCRDVLAYLLPIYEHTSTRGFPGLRSLDLYDCDGIDEEFDGHIKEEWAWKRGPPGSSSPLAKRSSSATSA